MVAKIRNTNLWDLFNPLLSWAVAQEEPNCPHGRQGQECEQQEAQYQTAQTVILCKKNTVSLRYKAIALVQSINIILGLSALSVCLSLCLSDPREHWYMLYDFLGSRSNIQIDQQDGREGLERGGIWGRWSGEGRIGEGGLKGIILCFSLTYETLRFTVPPAVSLLNYKRSWNISADFFTNRDFSRIFYTYHSINYRGAAKLRWMGSGHMLLSHKRRVRAAHGRKTRL
jgi:hypothetical protein